MKSLLRSLRNRCLADVVRKQDLNHHFDQIAGLLQIQNAMRGLPVLRPLRGWAISPDAMAWVLADLQERDSPTVIEFGSGQSTVILAAALKHRGGHLISVEHDPDYSKVIQKQVEACGLRDMVDYIASPLTSPQGPGSIPSYDTSRLPDVKIDIALVDGPPIMLCGPHTRLIPLKWAAAHSKIGSAIFLDDSNRASEQSCILKLLAAHPEMRVHERTAEKGLVEIRHV